jgi:hypothetical protein
MKRNKVDLKDKDTQRKIYSCLWVISVILLSGFFMKSILTPNATIQKVLEYQKQ